MVDLPGRPAELVTDEDGSGRKRRDRHAEQDGAEATPRRRMHEQQPANGSAAANGGATANSGGATANGSHGTAASLAATADSPRAGVNGHANGAPPQQEPHQDGGAPPANGSRKAQAKPQVSHSRLSFGEELEEAEAQPSAGFSLAQSTALRFETERELRLPPGNEPPAAAPAAEAAASPFFAQPAGRKALGPIIFGVSQARGPRPYMEDRYTIVSSWTPLSFASQPLPDDVARSFAAVYDGHNGCKAAEHACARLHMVLAQQPALRECTGEAAPAWAAGEGGRREAKEAQVMGSAVKHAFQVVDGEILERARAEQGRDGATALVVLRIGEVLWAAHAGDSRAVLCRGGGAVRLTQDHKPELSAEKARVEAAGGRVDFQRCWRVICPARDGRPASGLAVSRSFGDLDFKEPARFIECEPDVTRLRAEADDSFVVMASDGLWDVISDQESVAIVQEELASSAGRGESRAALEARAKEAADRLLEVAMQKGSMDNITVLLLLFQWH